MQWITIIWAMVVALCLMLAGIHLLVWCKQPKSISHLLLSGCAISAAIIAAFELATMRAQSPQAYGSLLRWAFPAVYSLSIFIVLFVRSDLHAGRNWLVVAVIVTRTFAFIVNLLHAPNLHYRQITAIRHLSLPGGEMISLPVGVRSFWSLSGHFGVLLVLVFVIDAMITVWRRGDRARAVIVCGSTAVFITLATLESALVIWGVIQLPFMVSIAYLGVVAALAYDLSSNVARSGRLAEALLAKEIALDDSEQRLSLAARTSGLSGWTWDIQHDDVRLSDQTQPPFMDSKRAARTTIAQFIEVLHPDDQESVRKAVARSLEGEEEYACEYRLPQADGAVRWIAGRGRVEFDAHRKPLRLRAVSIDITARKQLEETLRRGEEQFRQIVEGAPTAMIMINARGEIVIVNKGGEHLFGYDRHELIGKPIEVLMPESFREAHPRRRVRYQQDPKPRFMGAGKSLFALRKNGEQVPVEIGLNPVQTSEGSFVLASILDLTERRAAAAEAQQRRTELAHLSRVAMLGELSGALAHELNQPLTAILSNAEAAQRFLKNDPPDMREMQAILQDIVADDTRAGEVIRRLRTLLKKGDFDRQPLDVNDIIREVLKMMHSELVNRGCRVHTELADDLPKVDADRVQLQQVLLNLIINACDAMASQAVQDRSLTMITARDECGVRISVTDCGCGIPPQDLERVFDSFYTTKAQGMGLGLSVCRTIIDAHFGKLWATNNVGAGTSLHILFPESERK